MTARRASPYKLIDQMMREHPLQRSIAQTLRIEIGPEARISDAGVTWFCIDHANYHGEVPGARTGRGIVAGIFDLVLLYQGRAFWIEIKARDGVLSDAQRAMTAALLLCGCRCGVACDPAEVLHCLDEWGIPRKKRVQLQQRAA